MHKSVYAKRILKNDIVDGEAVIAVIHKGAEVLVRTNYREYLFRDMEKIQIKRELDQCNV